LATRFFQWSPSKTRRAITAAVFLAVLLIAGALGASQTLSVQDATPLNDELNQMRNTASVENIFGNNLYLALMCFVPVWGWIQGAGAMYVSGLVLVAESMLGPASVRGISPLLFYFSYWILPIFWLEQICFAIALSESFWLMVRGLQSLAGEKVSFKREIRNASTLITIITLTLLISAIIEMAIIIALNG
jgi:hypothetical protein